MSWELREDGGLELREDGSIELREGPDDAAPAFFRPPVRAPRQRRDGEAPGAFLRISARLRPGAAHGDAAAPGAVIAARAARHGNAPGATLAIRLVLLPGSAHGQTVVDRARVAADLLRIWSL